MSNIAAYWGKEDPVLHTIHHATVKATNRSEEGHSENQLLRDKTPCRKVLLFFSLIILIDFGENDFYIIFKAEENIEKISVVR